MPPLHWVAFVHFSKHPPAGGTLFAKEGKVCALIAVAVIAI